MFELSVLIPTFNRSKELIENVNTIVGTIVNCPLCQGHFELV